MRANKDSGADEDSGAEEAGGHAADRALPWWSWVAPVAAGLLLASDAAGMISSESTLFLSVAPVVLVVSVFAAVRHAETVSFQLGETLGTMLLALCVTAIEVSLIVSVMLNTEGGPSTVARDTVFAGVMIVLNGVVGIALLVGGARHHQQEFQLQGTTSALAVLGTLAVTSMVLPNYTLAEPGPIFSPLQLWFVSLASLSLYGVYLLVQAGSQRAYFVSPDMATEGRERVTTGMAWLSAALLVATLIVVVVLADALTPALRKFVRVGGLDSELVGAVIAMIVLMPEGSSAVLAAHKNRLQSGLNFALGSSIASVGLTIPAVSLLAVFLDIPIALGLEAEHVVMLVTTLFIAALTLSTGRTTVLQGAVHMVLFVIFLLIAAVP